jgi:MYXO-CTERM domain-containing protein
MRKTAFILSLMFLLALGLGLPVNAQNTAGDAGTYAADTDDDGPDLGWLGLLGLAGLLGLKRRDPVYRDTTRPATNPSAR